MSTIELSKERIGEEVRTIQNAVRKLDASVQVSVLTFDTTGGA